MRRRGSKGDRAALERVEVVNRMESSGTLVRPTKTAPARRRLAVTAESSGATLSLQRRQAVGCGLTGDVDVLLDGGGDAVQRPERLAALARLVGGTGGVECVLAEVDHDGVQRRVAGVDVGDDVRHDLRAAEPPRA